MTEKEVWKELLKQHDKLVASAQSTLYDRVTLLRKVYEDPHFLDDMRKESKSPVEVLDSRVKDTCANFTELLQVLKLFPNRKQWENGDLSDMRRQMLETIHMGQKKGGKEGEEELNGNRRLSWKQKYLELEAKYKELVASHKQLEKSYKELRLSLSKKAG